MSRILFDLVPGLLGNAMYLDISRDEIERILRQDGVFDRVFSVFVEDREDATEIPVRLVIQRPHQRLESISLALLLHEVRISGIDFEVKFEDLNGERKRGWHRHVWDAIEQDADGGKIAIDVFDDVTDLGQ